MKLEMRELPFSVTALEDIDIVAAHPQSEAILKVHGSNSFQRPLARFFDLNRFVRQIVRRECQASRACLKHRGDCFCSTTGPAVFGPVASQMPFGQNRSAMAGPSLSSHACI